MDGFSAEPAFLTNGQGPFGATTATSAPSNPRQSPETVFLVDAASHESSGAHREQSFCFSPYKTFENHGLDFLCNIRLTKTQGVFV